MSTLQFHGLTADELRNGTVIEHRATDIDAGPLHEMEFHGDDLHLNWTYHDGRNRDCIFHKIFWRSERKGNILFLHRIHKGRLSWQNSDFPLPDANLYIIVLHPRR